ncbi:HEAT repeat domain-containing protein [Limnoglobus roseus]|uniref:HEAT repeat domain-containing protein n=1 Tax=Limnoglobus roseus TaxID=2598579 RepID=A0A5C1AHW3_9BACT|nr:HEAT repeat domain-containing protein [Limnoglobus roseus]QEL19029.1 HEAT repeat domain-containing protein [Limnoglobus roseus]
MSLRRVMRASSVGLFVLGVCGLIATESFVSANKAEDAKKYTEQLKTSKDPKKRAEALEELGKLGQIMKSLVEPALPEIAKSLDDKNADVRKAGALAYGRVDPDPKDAVPALVNLLKNDKEEAVKIAAAQGLAAMGDKAKEAVSSLREVQKSEDKKSKLAKAAGEAMKSINGKKK